jgi:hypothetical protein
MSVSKLRERERKKGGGWREESNGLQLKKYCLRHSQQEQKGSESIAHQTPAYKHFACVVCKQPPYKHFACVVDGKETKIFGFLINLLMK